MIRSWNLSIQELVLSGLNTQFMTMLDQLSPEEVQEMISINNRTLVRNEQENEEIRKINTALSLAYKESQRKKQEAILKTISQEVQNEITV